MRTKNLLKLAFTMLAMVVMTGAMAQTYSATIETDYVRQSAGVSSYYTEGKAFTLYVHPDPAYSSGYNDADNTGINLGSLWTWNLDGLSAVAPWTDNTTPFAQNYVEISAVTLADAAVAETYTVEVAERFGAAGCVDATPTTLDVVILPKPSADIEGAAADADWVSVTADHEYYRCGELAGGENLTVTFVEPGVLSSLKHYAFSIQQQVYSIDGAGTETLESTNASFVNYGVGATEKYDATDDNPFVISTGALNFHTDGTNDFRTKYVYTLKGYVGSGSDGIVSQVSHKSDYTGAVTLYPFDGGALPADDIFTVTYVVNLPPVTGPIYHIPNNFNL